MHPNLFLAILTGQIIQLGPNSYVINHGYANAEFRHYFVTTIGAYRFTMGMN